MTATSDIIRVPPETAGGGGGDASAAKQDTGNASLSSIDGKVATAAKQDTGNASLSSIDGKVATAAKQDTGNSALGRIAPKVGPYQPSLDETSDEDGQIYVDPDGDLRARVKASTAEGSFRVNFANSSLSVSIGSATFVNGQDTVVCSIPMSTDIHVYDYVKLDADDESAWVQVSKINGDRTLLTLRENYSGTGGFGASSRALIKPTTGSGGSITVASGQCTIGSGTTSGSTTYICRALDVPPIIARQRFSISQRVANQRICFGAGEKGINPRWYARFLFDGTVNTTFKTQTARNPSTDPTGAEIEEYTWTMPDGLTTSVAFDPRIEVLEEAVRFSINGKLVATHTRTLPAQHDEMEVGVLIENTGTPSGNTNVVCDFVAGKNHNKLEVGVMSEFDQIAAIQPTVEPYNFSGSGNIAAGTVIIQVDCSRFKSLQFQCTSMGTSGVVTPEWSNDGATWVAATSFTQAGASATTFNAAGLWNTNVVARHFRLRVSTTATAGNTIVFLNACSIRTQFWLATQPVSLGSTTANIGTSGITAYTDSSSNLAGAATFTGTSRDAGSTNGMSRFTANATADVAGTLRVEKSTDNATWRLAESIAVGANEGKSLNVPVTVRYYRVVYINGAGAQSVFLLTSAYNRI